MRLRFVIGGKISRYFLHQSKAEPSQMVTELSLTFFLQKVFSYFTWQFFLSALQAALLGGVMKVSCSVCAINPQPCQFSLSFATLEPRRKLGPVNFRKKFWDCYWGQGKLNARPAIPQMTDLLEANISAYKISLRRGQSYSEKEYYNGS